MKKMFLGGMLFLSGFIAVIVLVFMSIIYPCSYNGIDDFKGFLLSYGLTPWLVIIIIITIWGLSICVLEAYDTSAKEVYRIIKKKINDPKDPFQNNKIR